ncbi:sushi, nidogen and EGF-like domain-containing protein 1 [Leptodactylus fuscus]
MIQLYSNIKLFGNLSSFLYVNNNGLLSFKFPISAYTPSDLPVKDSNPFLAPFWTDINNAVSGDIYYRQSNDPSLLSQATSDIRSYFSIPSFSATLVFVATWDRVAFIGSSSSSSAVNTFQAVLSSNGSLTFIMFNYKTILWPSDTASKGRLVLAGVNSGYNTGYCKIPGSLLASIINITTTSNVYVPGRWVFRVDTLDPDYPNGIIAEVTLGVPLLRQYSIKPVSSWCLHLRLPSKFTFKCLSGLHALK